MKKPICCFTFLKSQGRSRGLVFCRTKIAARNLAQELAGKYNSEALHGDLLQKERDKVMRAFKNKKLQILWLPTLLHAGWMWKSLPMWCIISCPKKPNITPIAADVRHVPAGKVFR
jgi:hypothetical protein